MNLTNLILVAATAYSEHSLNGLSLFQPKIFKDSYTIDTSKKIISQKEHDQLDADYKKGLKKYAVEGNLLPDVGSLEQMKREKQRILEDPSALSGRAQDVEKRRGKLIKESNELQKLLDANTVLQKPVGTYFVSEDDPQEVKQLAQTMETVQDQFKRNIFGNLIMKQSEAYQQMKSMPIQVIAKTIVMKHAVA
ncbi:MAG: hypothetical protein WCE21_05625 [Candidatus Babeliales bacterium]